MASSEASSRNRGPGARQAGLGGQGAPTLIGFLFFVCLFSGAPLLGGGGRWEARARLLGRVRPGAPGVGTEVCRGTATRGRLCGLLPGAHRALPARLLCSSGVAGKSGRPGGALRRPHPSRPSADPEAPAAPAGGWGGSALQAACLGPRLRASGRSSRWGQGCARTLPRWGRPAGRRRAHSRRRVGAWSLTGPGCWGFYTPHTPHTQDAWPGARGREEDDPQFSLEERTVGGGGGGERAAWSCTERAPGSKKAVVAARRARHGGRAGAGGRGSEATQGRARVAGCSNGDLVRAVPRGLSRGGTAGTARILEIKLNLGIQGRAGAVPSPTLLCLLKYSRALLGT